MCFLSLDLSSVQLIGILQCQNGQLCLSSQRVLTISGDTEMQSPNRKVLATKTNTKSNDEDTEATPPKPPRSAFVCFQDSRKNLLQLKNPGVSKDDILKIVAEEWKQLTDEDRAYWDEESRDDKVRFVQEKAAFKGTWNIPKRRAKKHPLAPKRPMSAFLKFSQQHRGKVKHENPDMGNTDVSRLLGAMWRAATLKEKEPFIKTEEQERARYKEEVQKFRENQAKTEAASRANKAHVSHSYDTYFEPHFESFSIDSHSFEYQDSVSYPRDFAHSTSSLRNNSNYLPSVSQYFPPTYQNPTYSDIPVPRVSSAFSNPSVSSHRATHQSVAVSGRDWAKSRSSQGSSNQIFPGGSRSSGFNR